MSQLLGMNMQFADFWGWLAFAAILLGIEIFIGTQWLLWIAGAAGLVGIITLLPLEFGLSTQLILFAIIAAGSVFASKKYIKSEPPKDNINDPSKRMIGAHAIILAGFDQSQGDRIGQVTFDGVVWPAVLVDEVPNQVKAQDQVTIEDHREGKLYVKMSNL